MDPYLKLRPWTAIESCECDSVESLFLVDLLTDNPLHCGICRREVDPERIGLTAAETEAVATWYASATSLYRLWLDSGEYEDYAKARLVDPRGQINQRGLDVAARLSTRIPTRLWFFSEVEDGTPSKCPLCEQALDTNVDWGTGCCVSCNVLV